MSEQEAKKLTELVDDEGSAMPLIRSWIDSSLSDCRVFPPASDREKVLLETQVSTRSPLGAVVYETGGILIDSGWLRVLGSGGSLINRTCPGWNRGRGDGLFLFADDAVGGLFALNGGTLGDDCGKVYYWAPDCLHWQPLGVGYTDWLHWAIAGSLVDFYSTLRWCGWQNHVATLSADECLCFYPFLWSEEGAVESSHRSVVAIAEAYDQKCEIVRGLSR